ncbi:MAG: helix-turn-helix domain-containing protein [Nitriliruptorales bacterium]|nr:helix-turn-helix domain-containing protein [Nitriliruptorales bacterium]
MGTARTNGGVQSVRRAAAVLSTLAESQSPLSAAEVARRTNLNRTIVYRLLRTLESDGLVRGDGGRFSLGEMHLRFGQSYLEGLGFYRSTLAYAVLLSTRFVGDRPWVVSLGVPVVDEIMLVDRHWSNQAPLDIILDIGVRLPIAGSALGRSILALRPEADVRRLIGDDHYEQIADRLAEVRGSRVSFADGEVQAGVCAVASPICDASGEPVAAIAVSGTDLRPHLDPCSEVAQRVRRAAEDLGREVRSRVS